MSGEAKHYEVQQDADLARRCTLNVLVFLYSWLLVGIIAFSSFYLHELGIFASFQLMVANWDKWLTFVVASSIFWIVTLSAILRSKHAIYSISPACLCQLRGEVAEKTIQWANVSAIVRIQLTWPMKWLIPVPDKKMKFIGVRILDTNGSRITMVVGERTTELFEIVTQKVTAARKHA